jgi:Asp/Glu/hydantoin racemase
MRRWLMSSVAMLGVMIAITLTSGPRDVMAQGDGSDLCANCIHLMHVMLGDGVDGAIVAAFLDDCLDYWECGPNPE